MDSERVVACNLIKTRMWRKCCVSCKGASAREGSKGCYSPDMHGGSMKIRNRVVLKSKVPLEQMDLTQARLLKQKRPLDCGVSETENAMARHNRITNTPLLAVRAFVFALLLCVGSVQGWAQQNDQQQQMRGLDEQVQDVKSDVLSIAAELNR